MLTATVSGSFHRHMGAITAAVHELAALSVRVLSPADPRVVAAQGEFLFVASDRVRSVRLVQDRHLESIRAANSFGSFARMGTSASQRLWRLASPRRLAYPSSHSSPADLTLREYVNDRPDSCTAALRRVEGYSRPRRPEGVLIDPHASIEEAHNTLDRIEAASGDREIRVRRQTLSIEGLPISAQKCGSPPICNT